MASIRYGDKGKKDIQFTGLNGKRHTIRLGKISEKNAYSIKIKVEYLKTARITGHPIDDETARWLNGIDSSLSDKLSRVGLIPKRESYTLGQLLDEYFRVRTDVKPATLLVWGHTKRNLIEFVGSDKLLREITQGVLKDGICT